MIEPIRPGMRGRGATWGGLGIVLLSLLSYFYFHESITLVGLIGIAFILVGVVLCNLFGIDRG